MKINKICCIGAGYVGGPTMSVIAKKCPDIKVTVVDVNKDRIERWNSKNLNDIPIYEPGLKEIVEETRNKNLFFSSEIEKNIEDSEMIFISVNTPTKDYGFGKGQAADLKYIELCARTIAKYSKNDKIIVEKSTLPVRTAETIKSILENNSNGVNFEILSNPEFLAEGTAVQDLLFPDRVLIGGEKNESGNKAVSTLVEVYKKWVPTEKIITTNLWSSELSKLVANAFLAQRISSINSISALCEKTDSNIEEISSAIGFDSRIGSKFLKSSVGFGGSCFKKDILNLVYIAKSYNLNEVAEYWQGVININNYQSKRFAENIVKKLYNTVSDKIITIYGWAFKKNTNDSRESASIKIADILLDENAIINVYDPKVSKDQIISDISEVSKNKNYIKNKNLRIFNCPYKAAENSHAIAILTEWDEFIEYDWLKIYNTMLKPSNIFDGRNILDYKKLQSIGFSVFQIGKNLDNLK